MREDRREVRGREAELDTLLGLIDAARDDPFVAVIEGEAGIGKSAVLDEAVELGRRAGVEILTASAHELEQDRQFGPLIDALKLQRDSADPDRADLARLALGNTSQPGSEPGAARFAIVDGIVDLLQRLGDRRPILLAVEDLHFADTSTLITLGRVARSRAHLSVSLVCTTRPSGGVDEREVLLRTLDANGAARLVLVGLPTDAVTEMVAELVGATPGANLLTRVAGAAGNPLYVTELVRALQQEGLIRAVDGTADVEGTGLPPSARLTILRRIAFLPKPTLDVLQIAAVLGSAFDVGDLATATDQSASALLEALRPAIDASLFVADGGSLRFRHDLIHEAAYTDLPERIRSELHLEVARSLADAGAPRTRVAAHFERASTGPHVEASDAIWAAGEEALPVDPSTSLALWGAAIARTPADHPELRTRRVRHAFQASRTQGVAAEAVALALLDESLTECERSVVETGLVWLYGQSLQVDKADAVALGRRRAQSMQCFMAGLVGGAHLATGDLARAEAIVEQVLDLGDPTGDATEELALLLAMNVPPDDLLEELQLRTTRNLVQFVEGRSRDAVVSARRVVQIYDQIANGPEPGHASVIFTLSDAGFHAEIASVMRGITSSPRIPFPEIDAAWGFAQWHVGDLDAAQVSFETSLENADETGIVWVKLATAALLALIDLQRGDLAEAGRRLSAVGEMELGFGMTLAMWARARLAEAEGRPGDALDLLRGAWDLDAALGMLCWQRYYGPDLARLALAAGERDLAVRAAEGLEQLAELGDNESARAVAWRVRGLVDRDGVMLERAAEAYAAIDRAYDRARTLEEAAAILSTSDAKDTALAHLGRALDEYERIGAERDRTRAVRLLRDLGVQRRRAAGKARPTSGWESLTDAEQRVVDLIAERLTYREIGARLFISRRTVETHAANIFQKLGVRSKGELATAYANRTT